MKRKVLALISVLKPVDDSRMYEKIGLSLNQTNKYEINIIGFWAKRIPSHPHIHFFPLFNFHRLHWRRFTASWDIYKKLVKLKPDMVIATMPENLMVICLYKILFGAEIFYDVQENNARNIVKNKRGPWAIRHLLAGGTRLVETMCAPLVSQFLLAEKTYAEELPFTAGKSTIIENKYKAHDGMKPIAKKKRGLHFAYTGTIGESYGIFDAVAFAKAAFAIDNTFRLTIAGYCADRKTYQKLLALIKGLPFVNLVGGPQLVPHDQILEIIQEADFALLPYPINGNLERRIPTKMYECIYFKTPMVMRPAPTWKALGDQFNACYYFDYDLSLPLPLSQMLEKAYFNQGDRNGILWQTEEAKLLDAVAAFI